MDERIYTIEEILDSSELVFVDTSCHSFFGDLLWNSFDSRNYTELKKKELILNLDSWSFFEMLLTRPNTYTLPQVVEEIFDLSEGLSNKIRFLNNNLYFSAHNKHLRKKMKKGTDCKDLILRLQEQVWKNYKLAERKVYTTDDNKVDILTDMVKIIDGEIGLKRDTSILYDHYNPNKKPRDTDERLVANLYYHSIFSRDKPVLLTKDTDFIRLFGITGRMLGSNEFIPFNQEFRDGVVYNPLIVYLSLPNNGWVKGIDSSNFNFEDKFKINFTSLERSTEIKNQIFDLWKEFSYSDKINEQSDKPYYPAVNAK